MNYVDMYYFRFKIKILLMFTFNIVCWLNDKIIEMVKLVILETDIHQNYSDDCEYLSLLCSVKTYSNGNSLQDVTIKSRPFEVAKIQISRNLSYYFDNSESLTFRN